MVNEETVWKALTTVIDPEIPFSIVDLGLVYGVDVAPSGAVRVQVTLTARGCPLVRRISDDVRDAVQRLTAAEDVAVEVVWDPPWNPGMATEETRRRMGWH
jgi:metal-sulfur cluster biosynthetic enzyme